MFLDTSVLIELLLAEKDSIIFDKIYDNIKDEPNFISMIQVGEISDWCLKNGGDPKITLSRLKEIIEMININEDILFEGSRIKYDMREMGLKKFSLMDGIILASARSLNETLLTFDSDFRKADNVLLLEK